MEAQPLETIPEETTKNPGHVASGKRLAERNRLAREAKNKPKHKNPLQKQKQMTPQTPQTNPAATASQVTLIWVLAV